MGTTPQQKRLVRETVEKFPALGNRTISRIILHNYGDMFGNDIERIRNMVRHLRGAFGKASRAEGEEIRTPAALPQTWREVRTDYNLSPGLWLMLSDIHVPFHDMRAVEAAIDYGKKHKVDGIFFNGDIQDCASISFWSSGRKRDFDKEVMVFIEFLDFISAEFPDVKKVYKPGNHEYRLPRYYQMRAPELIGIPLAVVDSVLDLEARGYEYLEYSQKVKAGKLPILHGHEVRKIATTVNPARGLYMRFKSWGMCAHVHRTSEHTERDINGTIITTWSVGCLCDLSPDYDPYTNSWNHGFALVNVEKDGNFEVDNFRILRSGKVR